nr:hypothetical protein [Priestia taiwanensis]
MLESFGHEFLVACPTCKAQAKVYSLGEYSPYQTGIIRRFSCLHCGLSKEYVPKRNHYNQSIVSYSDTWVDGSINIGGAYDWFFGYPLYLQTSCCGNILWAYNFEHLLYIKRYVEAELRGNYPYYLSMESRFPLWMKSAKNRAAVLKAIDKLEGKARE